MKEIVKDMLNAFRSRRNKNVASPPKEREGLTSRGATVREREWHVGEGTRE